MLRTIVLAVTVAASLTASAPAAHAAPVQSDCAFAAVAQADVTGSAGAFSGLAYGFAVFADGGPHTLRCYVAVNGVEQSPSTPTGAGNVVVATAGPVAYAAAGGDLVEICAVVDEFFPTRTTACQDTTQTEVPPREVVDAIFDVLEDIELGGVDPIVCPILASLAPGIPGVVDIRPEGDTTVAGIGPVWDCPPYGNLFPPPGEEPSHSLTIHTRLP